MVAVKTEDDRAHMSDNYFPLLPGVAKEVVIVGRPGTVKAHAVKFQYKKEEGSK